MKQSMQPIDYIVFLVYFVIVSVYGYWIYQKRKTLTTIRKIFSWLQALLPGGQSAPRSSRPIFPLSNLSEWVVPGLRLGWGLLPTNGWPQAR